MIDYLALADVAYAHAEANYGAKDARYDTIVECLEKGQIASYMQADGVTSEVEARRWADTYAGLMHEVELNQAWDGPESCVGSSRYDPAYDPRY